MTKENTITVLNQSTGETIEVKPITAVVRVGWEDLPDPYKQRLVPVKPTIIHTEAAADAAARIQKKASR